MTQLATNYWNRYACYYVLTASFYGWQTNYWIWRVDPSFRGMNISQERDRVRNITLSQAPTLKSISSVLLLKSVTLYRVVLIHFG